MKIKHFIRPHTSARFFLHDLVVGPHAFAKVVQMFEEFRFVFAVPHYVNCTLERRGKVHWQVHFIPEVVRLVCQAFFTCAETGGLSRFVAAGIQSYPFFELFEIYGIEAVGIEVVWCFRFQYLVAETAGYSKIAQYGGIQV